MISIFALYEQLKGAVNSHQGGHIRPYDLIDWTHRVQMEIYNDRIEAFQKTQKIADEITPFLESVNVIVSNSSGQSWDLIGKPPGYENFASARIIKNKNGDSCGIEGAKEYKDGEETKQECKAYVDPDDLVLLQQNNGSQNIELPVQMVDNDRWSAISSHPRKKPTCSNPKITQYAGGFKMMPKNCATSIVMDFFRLPVRPVFNYTIINQGLENEYYQFNPIGSVDLEWSQQLLPEILSKLIDKYSIFVGDSNLFQQSKVEQQ